MTMTEQSIPQLPAPAEDEQSLGPAMAALNRSSGHSCAICCGCDAGEAVAAAGYSTRMRSHRG